MIYEFSFSNFRSYRSEATIDFSAKPITEFQNSLINAGDGTSLIPVCVVYGPNGGGKSSALMAVKALRDIIIEPLVQMAFMKSKNEKLLDSPIEELQESLKAGVREEYCYKWDDDSQGKPTRFSILFGINNKKYRYELAINKDSVTEENLFMEVLGKDEVISVFERDDREIYLCEELEGIDIEKMNEGLPLLSYISLFKDLEVIDDAIRFFLNLQIINFDKPSQDRRILVAAIEKDKRRILNVLQSMGIDICDIRIEYDNDGKVTEIYTRHTIADGKGRELKFREESSGTRKVFSIMPVILRGIDKGNFFIIDELDAKLHPLLLKRIIELFTDSETNPAGAQMLFTSHDLTTMSNEVFRRDEIWFSAINGYNESVLYSLVDFKKENGDKPRKDENYNKQYLEGRYGADPYMQILKNWEVVPCH